MSKNINEESNLIKNSIKKVMDTESPVNVMKGLKDEIRTFIGKDSYSILAIGKASVGMCKGLEDTLKKNARIKMCLSPNFVDGDDMEYLKGNHPVPMSDTFKSSRHILESYSNDDAAKLIFLLSGGASSLFEVPIDEVGTEKYACLMDKLVKSGHPIDQMNFLRCQLSMVKCGQMINHTSYGEVLILAISDVPSDEIGLIGSNPFYPPSAQMKRDGEILKEFGINGRKITYRECKIKAKLVLNGEKYAIDFLNMMDTKRKRFFLGHELYGDVRECSDRILKALRKKFSEIKEPFFYSMCGETTSIVNGNGKGGRNCYLSALVLQKSENSEIFSFLSLASDGMDGNSGYAGFLVDSSIKKSILDSEIDKYIENSDTGSLAEKYNAAINTGPSGNNVSDIVIGYYGGQK